ncbi:P-loop containing nucleoside triphosphate hydrolase protein [Serendipita vermifera]|nr:P-loop containing nucleoside triphosphate hydrolase protein [Serendipita vermifera]
MFGQNFTQDYDEDEEKLLIAVLGPTGTGKSTFINAISDSDLQTSDDAFSCTQEVHASRPFEVGGQDIILLDTPGFDDSHRSDNEILEEVAKFLKESYKKNKLLTGLLFFYPILSMRAGGTTLRNIRLFLELVGSKSFKSVVVVTTMWDMVTKEFGEKRWKQLQESDHLFKGLLDGGGQIMRHLYGEAEESRQSAQNILEALLDHEIREKTTKLRIQEEMGDKGKALVQTRAARVLVNDYEERIANLEKSIREQKAILRCAFGEEAKARLRKRIEEEKQSLKELKVYQARVGHSRGGIFKQRADSSRRKALIKELS